MGADQRAGSSSASAAAAPDRKSSPDSRANGRSALNQGIDYAERGRTDLAERAFKRAMSARDLHVAAEAAWQLGKLAFRREDLAGAQKYFQRAVDSNYDDVTPRAYNGLGAVFAARHEVATAELNYLRAIESGHPDVVPRAGWNLGLLLQDMGDLQAAEGAFARVAESGHAEMAPRAATQLGIVRAQLGNARGAARALGEALQADDSDVAADAALNLGLVRLSQGDATGAEEAWNLALQSPNPEHVEGAREYLGLLKDAQAEGPGISAISDATTVARNRAEPADDFESEALLAPALRYTTLTPLDEVIALSADETDSAAVLRELRAAEVFGLGHPAGDLSPDGHGTESDILHFAIDDDAGDEHVLVPVFTQQDIMRRALLRNPDWQEFRILHISGGALYDNVDDEIAVVINPWSRLEFQLPRRSRPGDAESPSPPSSGTTPKGPTPSS